MAQAWWIALVVSTMPSTALLRQADSERSVPREMIVEIEQTVFRQFVRWYCQQKLCLLAVKGEPLEEARLEPLAELGQVGAPSVQDLELDGSGMSGAGRRGAKILDITKVIVDKSGNAVAHVSMYDSVLDTTGCKVRLWLEKDEWHVDESVRCTA